jgi:hypothetical protein
MYFELYVYEKREAVEGGGRTMAAAFTMAAAVANLKRILAVCGDRKVFIITPLLRYINDACCGDAGHCTHKLIPDSATKLLLDLGRLHRFIERRLSSFPPAISSQPSMGRPLLRFWPPTPAGGPSMAQARPIQEWRSLLLTKCCPATSRSHSIRRQRLTAVERGSEPSPAPLPVARDLRRAHSVTLAAICFPASPRRRQRQLPGPLRQARGQLWRFP